MTRVLKSFKVQKGNKFLDYRLGKKFNLNQVELFFQQNYQVKKLWNGSRHVLGILTQNNVDYFLKLSTSKGISVVTKNEYEWNNYFNENYSGRNFIVPKNHDSGLYQGKYFYLVTDYFNGNLLCEIYANADKLILYIPQIIEFSEVIQKLPRTNGNYTARFSSKAKAWLDDIPTGIRHNFKLVTLLEIIEKGVSKLSSKVRHGDFAPWHIIKLPDGKLGLVDGEHFLPNGIENYDICYFIQRVFSVLKNPDIAKKIYAELIKKEYSKDKLKVMLAARAIGGFLDESLVEKADYKFANSFKNWVLGI